MYVRLRLCLSHFERAAPRAHYSLNWDLRPHSDSHQGIRLGRVQCPRCAFPLLRSVRCMEPLLRKQRGWIWEKTSFPSSRVVPICSVRSA
ncbi:hypothetical protein NDU88_004756 [Pleurodeles waltl]|uniref:Uncharacterized protein n=1 Tax=Pleurodeles waltl TaxID=8319 RepID=A0AAV7QFF5_PLEWA|nr:hypothetical protein NDU88_004756 [Pleurodeles waltl]